MNVYENNEPVSADRYRSALATIQSLTEELDTLRARVAELDEAEADALMEADALRSAVDTLRAALEVEREVADELRAWFRDLEVNVAAKSEAAQRLGPERTDRGV